MNGFFDNWSLVLFGMALGYGITAWLKTQATWRLATMTLAVSVFVFIAGRAVLG